MHPAFRPLSHAFYDRNTTEVARDLVGRTMFRDTGSELLGGIIVETEAYGPDDPANHAHRGLRPRNAVMFGPPGFAYVYRIYGMYWCVNAVTRGPGIGEAVLIRALEPTSGIETMRANRGVQDIRRVCSGPGRLCEALGIAGVDNGADLAEGPLFIGGEPVSLEVVATARVGITKAADLPWRFCAAGSPYLSRPPFTSRPESNNAP